MLGEAWMPCGLLRSYRLRAVQQYTDVAAAAAAAGNNRNQTPHPSIIQQSQWPDVAYSVGLHPE